MGSRQGICAICGERASIDGYTKDNRVILTCGDAVPPNKVSPWNRLRALHNECKGAYLSDRAHGIIYPASERWFALMNRTCLYCAKSIGG